MIARGLESPYLERLRDWEPDPAHDARITTRVPCADFFDVRDRALIAHATQIDPEGAWFAIPAAVQREAWPTEDFELVTSLVQSQVPEDDLFAGVREVVGVEVEAS
jgi:mycothiol S-conjugate amidase